MGDFWQQHAHKGLGKVVGTSRGYEEGLLI